MQTRTRRRFGWAALAGGCVLVGGAAIAGAIAADTERMTSFWTRAEVASDGSGAVTEVIDWNFGNQSFTGKHGIFRFIPGLPEDTPITVDSPDAPHQTQISTEFREGQSVLVIKIGDPDKTVSGRRRYRIDYKLPGMVQGTRLDWETMGDLWPVDIENAEIHLLTPFEVSQPQCIIGTRAEPRDCEVEQVEPGHLVAHIDKVPKGQGVSIEGDVGAPVATLPAVPQPPAPPDDPGTGLVPPGGTAAALCLVAGIPAALLVRRAGRERVAAGGEADIAYADGTHASEIRIDAAELANMATIEFAPPAGVNPAQGGIVLREEVRAEHKVAWLIQAAIDGAIDLDDRDHTPTITRTGPGSQEETEVLDMAFGGRPTVELGSYDPAFSSAWSHLGNIFSGWRDHSGLWDKGSQARRVGAMVLGVLVLLLGAAGAAGGGALANRFGPQWLPLAAVGGALFGAGLAAVLGAWELPVRTPAGSGLFLRVESFRRFLAESEAYHAEEAAKRGVLREYTAWAVALDEIDRWSRAVSASSIIPETAGLGYVHMAPLLMASTLSASTAPRQSGGGGFGGGGFGGGGIGGGAGGGGGGSW